MKCIVLRHLAFEDLGIFAEVLIDQGFEVCYLEAGQHDLTGQNLDRADLLVVLGGPIGVYEASDYPWLRQEIEIVERRLRQDLPTLGICLGAQIMAAALGAAVYPGREKEIGWSTVQLTPAARGSCLETLEQVAVLHWHGDTYDLPAGATLLASTDLTPNQAFSFGRNALALQFHAEADGAQMEPWLIGHTLELRRAGINIPDLRQAGYRGNVAKVVAGRLMLARWLAQVGLAGAHRRTT